MAQAASPCLADVGGQHCHCPVFISFLSEFPENPIWHLSGFLCLDSARICGKNAVRCLPVRPENDEEELFFSVLVRRRLILSLNFSPRVGNINYYNISDISDESGLCFAIFHL